MVPVGGRENITSRPNVLINPSCSMSQDIVTVYRDRLFLYIKTY